MKSVLSEVRGKGRVVEPTGTGRVSTATAYLPLTKALGRLIVMKRQEMLSL
jgi:hypothetical protein